MKKIDYHVVASALSLFRGGKVEVTTDNTRSLIISAQDDLIDLNFHDTSVFKTRGGIGILDSLNQMKNLGKALADKDITLSISRKNSPVLRVGKMAKPRFSRIATRSNEIQIMSLRGLRKLENEL